MALSVKLAAVGMAATALVLGAGVAHAAEKHVLVHAGDDTGGRGPAYCRAPGEVPGWVLFY
ncbi:hypothetical protein [Streptomyces pseudogriseolus]|uniref:hypothetical protein n=1 Tax=Streptomyces pseudogriseolus TaxID=36817 RepID=UPI003FA33ACD|nr:hypothetical protein [Streptomyces pseudogriseolus]